MIHSDSSALLTDFYEITMAYGYWKQKIAHKEAVFHLFFRRLPFEGGFCIAAGLEGVIDYLSNYSFKDSDIEYLKTFKDPEGAPLFEEGFLDYLKALRFSCDIDAIPEGEVVFPYEPLLRVKGPIIQAQLLETALLNLTNFPSLIATKAARISIAARGDPVWEFGLRRAQGVNGAATATRAAYIGGCAGTSNVLMGKELGIPVRGTHAHSWVMSFPTELQAFQAYAEAMPSNALLLVDTYDTLNGVRNAIKVGEELKKRGQKLLGIRLDSGDLAYLSIESRKLLDQAGFPEVLIMASNELNEIIIADLKAQGAAIDLWGVGTHLVTGYTHPALDGVYKLSALREGNSPWEYKLKISERISKVSTPGVLQVRRYHKNGEYLGDAIYDEGTELSKGCLIIDPVDRTREKRFKSSLEWRDLLVPIFRQGECVYTSPSLHEIREKRERELSYFDRSIKRFIHPYNYPAGLEASLDELKIQLMQQIRKQN